MSIDEIEKMLGELTEDNRQKVLHEIKIRDTEIDIACSEIVDIVGECAYDHSGMLLQDSWCEQHCSEQERLLCWDRYLREKAEEKVNENQ